MFNLQAQQFSWVKQYYPSLYEKMKIYIKQGRFIPVGGTWIEMDGNIPRSDFVIFHLYYSAFLLMIVTLNHTNFELLPIVANLLCASFCTVSASSLKNLGSDVKNSGYPIPSAIQPKRRRL